MELLKNEDSQTKKSLSLTSFREAYVKGAVKFASKELLPPLMQDKTFGQLKGDINKVTEKCKLWDFKNPMTVSILSNKNGIGKTHIAVCLFKKFLFNYYTELFSKYNTHEEIKFHYESLGELPYVKFASEKKLLAEIQRSYDSKKQSEYDILEYYSKFKLLVIDDMFSTRDNDFAKRTLFYIIDERSEYLGLPTVLTSNYLPEEIKEIDSRIISRISNNMMFKITSNLQDYRQVPA